MVDEEATFQKFGYKSINLTPQSGRRIVVSCDGCFKVREVKFQNYRSLCMSCAAKKRLALSKKSIDLIKQKLTGRAISAEQLRNHRAAQAKLRGANSIQWKGGISPLREHIYQLPEYHTWRTSIFIRDKGICQACFVNKAKEVHHDPEFRFLYRDFLKEYDQFSPIEDKETLLRLAVKYQPFWAASGKALCVECHNATKGGPKKCSTNT